MKIIKTKENIKIDAYRMVEELKDFRKWKLILSPNSSNDLNDADYCIRLYILHLQSQLSIMNRCLEYIDEMNIRQMI